MVVSWRDWENRAMAHGWKLLQELSAGSRNEFLAKLALTASLLSGFVDSWP
jgi:hypothetical protein